MPKAELTAIVTPKCQRQAEQLGFELVDVCLDKEGAGKYLRIYIDKPEGISLRINLSSCCSSSRFSRMRIVSIPHPISTPTIFGHTLSFTVIVVPIVQPFPL